VTNLLEAKRNGCSTKKRGVNQTVFAPPLIKLLEAGAQMRRTECP
jgi:hypothetical protein